MKPIISVVVPAYNEEKYLPLCLEALTHQDFSLPYEIIVVNNNSTDKTVEIVKSIQNRVALWRRCNPKGKHKIKLVLEKQKGQIFARQKGLLSAGAEIVVNCDADTKPPKNWLSLIYKTINQKKAVLVTGPVKMLDGPRWHSLYNQIATFIYHCFSLLLNRAFFCLGPNHAVKKAVFLSAGGYDTRVIMGEDEWGIISTLKKRGKVIYNHQLVNYSSGRRAKDGFLVYFFYDLPIKYGLNYLWGKIFKCQIAPFYSVKR